MATLAISHLSLDDVTPVAAVIVGDVRIGKAPKQIVPTRVVMLESD